MQLDKTYYIELIKNYFESKPIVKAFLFGSYSRGTANENSDIDLLVELDYSDVIGFKFISMKLELEDILGLKVDLVSSNGLSKHLKPHIDKEKELIYAR